MRQIRTISALCALLLCLNLPTWAATYTQQLTANFGSALTGKAASLLVTVIDATGTTQIAATNTPPLGGGTFTIAESLDAAGNTVTGNYYVRTTFDTTWAYPVKVKWTMTGQAGVVAEAIIGTDRAMAVADGYTAARASNLSNLDVASSTLGTLTNQTNAAATAAAIKAKTDLIATNAADSPNAVTAQTNAASAATTSTSNGTAIAALPTAAQIAAAILVTPSQKLVTNGSGFVTVGAVGAGAVAPTGYFANLTFPDPFATVKTGTTYGGTTWGSFFGTQLTNPVPLPSAFTSDLLANARFQKIEAAETGNYLRSPTTGVITFTTFAGTTYTATVSVDGQGRITGRVVN